MPIIGGPQPYIVISDPYKGTRILRDRVSTTIGISSYPAFNDRYVWLSRIVTQTVSPYDLKSKLRGTPINIGSNPVGIWINGRILWKISSAGSLVPVDLFNGSVGDAITLPASTYAGLTGNGRKLYTMDSTDVIEIDVNKQTTNALFAKPSNAKDLHHDERWLWILTGASSVQGVIRQYDPNKGTESSGSFNITNYGISDSPTGLTGNGRYLFNTELIV